MKLKDFIDKYVALENVTGKEKLIQSIISRRYCPVGEKYAVFEDSINKSIVTDANGCQYINMFISKINLMIGIVILYTNIDLIVDKNNKIRVFDSYDMLVKSGALKAIIDNIGEDEIDEIMSVNRSIIDTFNYKNNSVKYNIYSVLDRFTTIFSGMTNEGLKELVEIINDEKKTKVFEEKLNKLLTNHS